MKTHFFILLIQIIIINCFFNTIPNCVSFDNNTNSCAKCDDNYFPLFHNLFCIPCDDQDYGQIGCDGNCDGSNFENDRFAICEENGCKEGFYYLGGKCINCTEGSQGCKKCYSNLTQTINRQINYKFTCQECLNNEYKLNEFGICQKCQMNNCLECKFTGVDSNKECIRCANGYYLTSSKTCERCHDNVPIQNGYCTVCSDDLTNLERARCYCYNSYMLNKNNTCSLEIEGCHRYFKGDNDTINCLSCESGRILYNNQCLKCPQGCDLCYFDNNTQETKCLLCYSEFALINGQCQFCSEGCRNCILDENDKKCSSCFYYFGLNSNKSCTRCSDIANLGKGCVNCQYNETKDDYECLECNYYNNGVMKTSNYSYIKNTFQCLDNTNKEQIYLYGCLEANIIENDIYECLKCKEEFIPIINNKICFPFTDTGLSNYCLEAINLGNETQFIFSCNKCDNEKVLITKLDNISVCSERTGILSYCEKAIETESGELFCTECVSHAHLNESSQGSICECNYDSYGIQNLFCYKCDDEIKGNPGCLAKEGCEFRPNNNQLICNKCKDNYYFDYTKEQCFSCSNEIEFCNKCHLDEKYQFICDGCLDIFNYNKNEKICQLSCEEHPEISPGCIICNEEYKLKRKCQICKPGYFKTDNESCVYCKSEQYGGPACNKCMKNETNGNIICEICKGEDKILSSNGKCYFISDEIIEECEIYKSDEDESDKKLICIFCKTGFYLDPNGNCVEYLHFLEKNENCPRSNYKLRNLILKYNSPDFLIYNIFEKELSISSYNINQYNETILEFINSNLMEITGAIKGKCEYCNSGFFMDNGNKCSKIKIKFSDCSIISMLKNDLYKDCQDFCKDNHYPLVILNYTNINNDSSYTTISEIYDKLYYSVISLSEIQFLEDHTLCIDNSNQTLNNCVIVKFIESENKYVCHLCREGFFLYEETNKCIKYDAKFNCEYENIGNETNPIFSCKKCRKNFYFNDDFNNYNNYFNYYQYDQPIQYLNNYYSDYILVKEDNINFCVKKDSSLSHCLNATADTTYAIDKYNCTSCEINYLPYYFEYFGSFICQNIFEEIKMYKNIFNINPNYPGIEAINGECPNNTFFTPNGKYCYECNSNIGMPECKSQCSFSLDRNDAIKCLDGCKEGYIEGSEGICQPCYQINYGCDMCHYGEYPEDYIGIKRKRKFICDNCIPDYYVLIDDKCTQCNVNENYCEQCEIKNNQFKCKKCSYPYYLDENGHCDYCDKGIIIENKCIKCNDTNNGGIEGCNNCYYYQNKSICQSCEDGYILLDYNKTCLKRTDNKDLKKYNKCSKITLKDNKFLCLECNDNRFSVLKEDNESLCIYLPELNGFFDNDLYNYTDLYYYEKNPDLDYIYKFYFNKYISNYYFSQCVEAINLISKDNPLYSCVKCSDSNYLFAEENSNISYCIKFYNIENNNKVQNCIEKKIKIMDKKLKFTCVSCIEENYNPVYDENDKVKYCRPIELEETTTSIIICMAKNCKKCKSGDNYFCEICISENYVINNATGDCIEKNESFSSTDWIISEVTYNFEICLAKNCKKCNSDDNFFCEICISENYVVDNATGDCIEKNQSFSSTDWIISEVTYNFEICLAKNCKKCKSGDNYFCEICISENYVINNATGDCIEKNESIFSTDWTANETTNSLQICLAKNCKQCKSDDVHFCEICEFDNYFVDKITGDCIRKKENISSIESIVYETTNSLQICLAKTCKQCKSDDEYFCQICELENYVVNNITGACMEKMENNPALKWKDIYRLEMNSTKEINGRIITGLKLNLRGETNSNINSGHAFIIYLIFHLKESLIIRNLQEIEDTIRIKAICEIMNGVQENKNDTNIVDYECIGDNERIDLNNYQLSDIEVGNDDISNLKALISSKNLLQLALGPTVEFTMDKITNQTSKDYNFDFTIGGKIDDNNIKEIEINKQFKLNEIDEPSDCIFIVERQKMANLNCKLNIKKYKKIKSFTFNTTKIEYNNEYNISFLDLNKVYLINDKKGPKAGLIIGIVVGSVAFIALLIVLIWLCKKRNKEPQVHKSHSKRGDQNSFVGLKN